MDDRQFTLDVDASDADAMLCLLNAIQESLGDHARRAQAILRRADGRACG